ncbi:MAG: VanZ family protein [Planctomycetota bacterium]|jgi:VanZ family protein
MRKIIICYYVIYVLIITYYSLTPIENIISDNLWDKVSHFFTYLILVILIKNVHIRLSYLTCILICCNYSFITECIQYYIPDRQLDVFDILANLLGTLLGVIINYLIIEKFFDKRSGVVANVVDE